MLTGKALKAGKYILTGMALNIHVKGRMIPKTISDCKKEKKYMAHFASASF